MEISAPHCFRRHDQGGFPDRSPQAPGERARRCHLASPHLESECAGRSGRPHPDLGTRKAAIAPTQGRPVERRENLKTVVTSIATISYMVPTRDRSTLFCRLMSLF